jgi:hypothetical protein
MFGWLKRKPQGLWPEIRWTLSIEDNVIRVTDPDDATATLAMADLSAVIIETNDSGPWGADFWWLLLDCSGALACAFPQGATGEQAVVDRLGALPGFDRGKMGDAIRSTRNASFPVWLGCLDKPGLADD